MSAEPNSDLNIHHISMTFHDGDLPPETVDCLLRFDEGSGRGILLPAPGAEFPDFAAVPSHPYVPPEWTDICRGFLEPLADEVYVWWKELSTPGQDKETIIRQLNELNGTFMPILEKYGAQYSVDSWQRAEVWLLANAQGSYQEFLSKVRDLLRRVNHATRSLQSEDAKVCDSEVLPFLDLDVQAFLAYLTNLSDALSPERIRNEPSGDGPCPTYTWRHKGRKIDDRMQRATWELVNHLWGKKDLWAVFDELGKPMYGDHAMTPDGNQVGRQRGLANMFFRSHGIPWKVATSPKDNRVWLEGDSPKT